MAVKELKLLALQCWIHYSALDVFACFSLSNHVSYQWCAIGTRKTSSHTNIYLAPFKNIPYKIEFNELI